MKLATYITRSSF